MEDADVRIGLSLLSRVFDISHHTSSRYYLSHALAPFFNWSLSRHGSSKVCSFLCDFVRVSSSLHKGSPKLFGSPPFPTPPPKAGPFFFPSCPPKSVASYYPPLFKSSFRSNQSPSFPYSHRPFDTPPLVLLKTSRSCSRCLATFQVPFFLCALCQILIPPPQPKLKWMFASLPSPETDPFFRQFRQYSRSYFACLLVLFFSSRSLPAVLVRSRPLPSFAS